MVYVENPNLMLFAKVYSGLKETIDESGIVALKVNYKVTSIKEKNSRCFDLYLKSSRDRDSALETKYLAAGGLAIQVEVWKPAPFKLQFCDKCWRTKHDNECYSDHICKYCGNVRDHESKDCNYKQVISMHYCRLCGQNGHYATEKDICLYYIKEKKKHANRSQGSENINTIQSNNLQGKIKAQEDEISKARQEIQSNKIESKKEQQTANAKSLLTMRIMSGQADITIAATRVYSKETLEEYQEMKIALAENMSDSEDENDEGELSSRSFNSISSLTPTGGLHLNEQSRNKNGATPNMNEEDTNTNEKNVNTNEMNTKTNKRPQTKKTSRTQQRRVQI